MKAVVEKVSNYGFMIYKCRVFLILRLYLFRFIDNYVIVTVIDNLWCIAINGKYIFWDRFTDIELRDRVEKQRCWIIIFQAYSAMPAIIYVM